MVDRIRFLINRIRERLWVKPLAMCLLSIAGAFLAGLVDYIDIEQRVPQITSDSIEKLLTVISASMLVIATFAVGSMISAYASASSSATPRSFPLVVSDDVSQNALSTFIGAFIFSIVALVALMNRFYGNAGRFALFAITLFVFGIVIVTFVRWVDRIARLGRLGETIHKVEAATTRALHRRRRELTLGGAPVNSQAEGGLAVYGSSVGYIQRLNVSALQKFAEKTGGRIRVMALPGTFVAPGKVLAYWTPEKADQADTDDVREAFVIGNERKFDDDPRFGLIALSEIASRALSPAVNDPGTAIDIIGRFIRLFVQWSDPVKDDRESGIEFDRVEVPALSVQDMFDDAFNAIARDGAGTIEVMIRLQKAFHSLSAVGDLQLREASQRHARMAVLRAEQALKLTEELEIVRQLADDVGRV